MHCPAANDAQAIGLQVRGGDMVDVLCSCERKKRRDIIHLQDRQLQTAIAWVQENDAVRIVFAATDSVRMRNWMRRKFEDFNLSSKLFFMCLCVAGFSDDVCPHHGTSFPKPELGQLRQGTLQTFAYDVLFIAPTCQGACKLGSNYGPRALSRCSWRMFSAG